MNLIERIFALKQQACFNMQSDFDLARIAETATEKSYKPGELICSSDRTLLRVYIVTEGGIETSSGQTLPTMIGAASVLLNIPIQGELRASPDGAHCLLIEKGIFFTIVYQCPSIIHKLLASDNFDVAVQTERRSNI